MKKTLVLLLTMIMLVSAIPAFAMDQLRLRDCDKDFDKIQDRLHDRDRIHLNLQDFDLEGDYDQIQDRLRDQLWDRDRDRLCDQ